MSLPSAVAGAFLIAASAFGAGWVGSTQGDSTTLVGEIPPGTPYYYRLEAVRATDFWKFIAAQSDVVQYTVP